MDATLFWSRACEKLKEEISEAALKIWFAKVRLTEDSENAFSLLTPNAYAKARIETVYLATLQKIFSELRGSSCQLKLVLEPERKAEPKDLGPLFVGSEKKAPAAEEKETVKGLANLSPYHTFANFIIGSNNRLAFAMASAVAKSPGANTNNPFFLYADVGLGKTHLVQALGNELIKTYPALRILYTTSENFTNELIEAIQHRTQKNFRKKFRAVDVLIVDDIQFISGRESTQEEFFNTFNTLFLSQKQIIITSDRPPREIARLEERLTSRFGGGITADIQEPDFDTRLAILRTKTENLNLIIPPEILEFLAESIQSNIRELEGGLKQVVNVMLAQNGRIFLSDVRNLFEGVHATGRLPNIDPRRVIDAVCQYYTVRPADVSGKRRTQTLVRPRQVAMYLLREVYKLSLARVGDCLGGKDHTTVLHGSSKIEEELKTSPGLKNDVEAVRKLVEK